MNRSTRAALAALVVLCSAPALAGTCDPDEAASPCSAPSASAPSPDARTDLAAAAPVTLEMYYAHDCPHCHEALAWLPKLQARYPGLTLRTFEVKREPANRQRFEETMRRHGATVRGVPTFVVGDQITVGFFADQTCAALSEQVHRASGLPTDAECERSRELRVPLLGTVRLDRVSLLQFTLVLGLLDSLNPCAMWVLTFLLGLLVYSRRRERILLVGGIFVAASGLVYFAFMAAWLNLFTLIGMNRVITVVLGGLAMVMGAINVKELFFFKRGPSLTIPESAKPKIAQRVRRIMNERSTPLVVLGTGLLAVFANFVELGCTVGFPAIYTKVLAERVPDGLARYGYMALYNVAYVVPLALIVLAFALTLGHFKLGERHGRVLKLVSGLVMLALGAVMLFVPEWLAVG